MKYVVVTGGVVSGLGKGVTASSLGVVLKGCGLRVTSIKIDPYLNADAGTMSPFEHGEVFVLDDGGEVDLDLGNYERFLDVTLKRDNNITTGRVYQSVIDKERRGDFLGKTVQVVPHITNAIQDWIEKVAKVPVDGRDGEPDVCVIELGGTVGDIESMPFFEAISQFHDRVGSENICLVHVSLVPVLGVVGEQKSKCTQHSVRELRALGLTPYLLACRSAKPLEVATKDKIAQFCHVRTEHVLSVYDVSNIWHIPLILREQNAHLAVLKKFNLFKSGVPRPRLEKWANMAEGCDRLSIPVKIAMVGKYTGLSDAYLSIIKALLHASNACSRKLVLQWVSATDLEDNAKDESPEVHATAWEVLKNSDGVLVPGGFGDRGVQGKILAAKYARESRVPFLGICLGLQIAVIEFARSVLGLKEANSTEFDQATPYPCVVSMPEISKTHMGGTMRLGSRRTFLNPLDCLTAKLYQHAEYIDERHRHRYEVNPDMVDELEAAGLRFVGKDETGRRMEIMEYPEHPYYVAVQFHPEFKSRPVKPSAVFLGLIMASSGQLDAYLRDGGNVKAAANGHCKIEVVANGHAKMAANGHAKEAANSHAKETANGHAMKATNGHAKNAANGHTKDAANGHTKDAANGHTKDAANGHTKDAANGHTKDAANGHAKDAANGHVKDAANGRLKGAPNRRVQASVNGLGEDATNGHVECCCRRSCGTCGKRTWEGLGKCCRISMDQATHHCTSVLSKSRKVESDMTRIIQ